MLSSLSPHYPQHINLAHSQTEINASKTFPEYLIRLSISQMEGNFSDLIFNLFIQ